MSASSTFHFTWQKRRVVSLLMDSLEQRILCAGDGTPPVTNAIYFNPPAALGYGEPVHLTATVTTADGASPDGYVYFNDTISNQPLGYAAVVNGVASLDLPYLSVGMHSLWTAFDFYDPTHVRVSSPNMPVNIVPNFSTITLVDDADPATYVAYTPFSLTAEVGLYHSSKVPDNGDVAFYDGNQLLQTLTLTDGKATAPLSGLSPGPHDLWAVYLGNYQAQAIASNHITLTAAAPTATIDLLALVAGDSYGVDTAVQPAVDDANSVLAAAYSNIRIHLAHATTAGFYQGNTIQETFHNLTTPGERLFEAESRLREKQGADLVAFFTSHYYVDAPPDYLRQDIDLAAPDPNHAFSVIAGYDNHELLRAMGYDPDDPASLTTFTQLAPIIANFRSPTRGLVTRLYEDVLGREPEPAGMDYWSAALEAHAVTPAEIGALFANSTEYRTQQIQHLYQSLLRRDMDDAGLAYWLNALAHGASLEDLQSQFYASDEFYTQPIFYSAFNAYQPASLTDYTTSLFYRFTQRSPGPDELGYWLPIATANRAAFVHGLIFSREYGQQLIPGLYRTYLQREPDTSDIDFWAIKYSQGTSLAALTLQIISSSEYTGA